jgi:hypothetical protein
MSSALRLPHLELNPGTWGGRTHGGPLHSMQVLHIYLRILTDDIEAFLSDKKLDHATNPLPSLMGEIPQSRQLPVLISHSSTRQ